MSLPIRYHLMSLLRRGAAMLSSIPIIFLMSLGGARGFAPRV
jgi:hypothetical protein